jgi:hypothetical protein
MKVLKISLLILCVMMSVRCGNTGGANAVDITARWDTLRVLLNPDKGWYHHYMDNSVRRYGLESEAELDTFPGMHHLFLRFAWAYLEPEEGQFRWETIDTVVARYTPKGYKISLDITCKETSGRRMPYATPRWVEKAGSNGRMVESFGSVNWEPDYNDPVFLEKLNNLHKAMAARYDGAEWLQDVTTGSIGEWGEGHSANNVRAEVVIKHLDILLNNYPKTQIVIGDDYLRAGKTPEETKLLREYVKKKGVSYRDDSVFWEDLVHFVGSIQNYDFFEDVWRDSPTTLEMCHYSYCKDRYWSVPNGYEKGLDMAKDAIRVAHATFISPHGNLGVWQKDNPQAAWELINMLGYRFFPERAEFKLNGDKLNMTVTWNNKGVAPAYKPYFLKISLIDENGTGKDLPPVDAGNKAWLPGSTTAHYTMDAPDIKSGTYTVEILLYKQFKDGSIRPVKLGLEEKYETPTGSYNTGNIKL